MGIFNWTNLGKKRTDFGRWLDGIEMSQTELEELVERKVGRSTISRMCSEEGYKPKYSTFSLLKRALRERNVEIEYDDFY
jgi:hypothetical protein